MERLTQKEKKVVLLNNRNIGKNFLTIKQYEKLQQLENIEEQLGIDLITLFRAIKSKIIWVKINKIEYHFEDEYNERNWALQDGLLYMYWEDGSHCCLELSNYGKTWALNKEKLEND